MNTVYLKMTLKNIVIRIFRIICRRKRLFAQVAVSWVIFSCVYKILNYSLTPRHQDLDLQHFKRNTHLEHYLDNIDLLIEPSAIPCFDNAPTPLLVLVASSPSNYEKRQAIRETWGQYLQTYFVLGLGGPDIDRSMPTFDEDSKHSYKEMKQYNDLIGYDFPDHYQNLTLKTVLMLQWTVQRCPNLQILFKTDDDVLVNPWNLKAMLKMYPDTALLGYMFNNTPLYRDEGHKWYIPRWMRVPDVVPRYLAGAGYFIRNYYIMPILYAAKRVPLINMEDIYITYLVANVELSLAINHDARLNPYTPLFGFINCYYLNPVLFHNDHYNRKKRLQVWDKILDIRQLYKNNTDVCKFYAKYNIENLLMYFSY